MGQETWRHSSVQYKFKTEKLCMVSNCLSAKNLHTKNKNMCDNVSPMGDTSLTSHFILKEIETQVPFPSIIFLPSFFLTELHHIP